MRNERKNFGERIAAQKGYRIEGENVIGKKGKPLKLRLSEDGYPYFKVSIPGPGHRAAFVKAHRLQAFFKFGEQIYNPILQVRHKNNVQTDFSWDNILIGTKSDNEMDKSPETRRRVSSMANRKHDPEAVRSFYEICGSYGKTMEHFGITSSGTLWHILNKSCGITLCATKQPASGDGTRNESNQKPVRWPKAVTAKPSETISPPPNPNKL